MRPEIVHVGAGNAHLYGGRVIERVVSFNRRYNLPSNPEFVFAELAQQMTVENPHTLVQVMLDKNDIIMGHGITSVQELYGFRSAMVYQLEVDREVREGREEAFAEGLKQILTFAKNAGCKAMRAWAMNEALAKVFEKYGMKRKEFVLIEREL